MTPGSWCFSDHCCLAGSTGGFWDVLLFTAVENFGVKPFCFVSFAWVRWGSQPRGSATFLFLIFCCGDRPHIYLHLAVPVGFIFVNKEIKRKKTRYHGLAHRKAWGTDLWFGSVCAFTLTLCVELVWFNFGCWGPYLKYIFCRRMAHFVGSYHGEGRMYVFLDLSMMYSLGSTSVPQPAHRKCCRATVSLRLQEKRTLR